MTVEFRIYGRTFKDVQFAFNFLAERYGTDWTPESVTSQLHGCDSQPDGFKDNETEGHESD